MTDYLLVHSPLVGPATWAAVATRLRELGHAAAVPDLTPALRGAGPRAERQVDLAARCAGPGPVTLVGHSGAGPLLPAIAGRLIGAGTPVTARIYVDAALPHPGRSRLDALPHALGDHLRSLAVDGWLPPWPAWWPPEPLADLVADPLRRAAFVDDCPALPMDLFTEPLPSPDDHGPSGFVQLSAAYAEEADQADAAGWPVRRLAADHLAPLTAPDVVAAALLDLPIS